MLPGSRQHGARDHHQARVPHHHGSSCHVAPLPPHHVSRRRGGARANARPNPWSDTPRHQRPDTKVTLRSSTIGRGASGDRPTPIRCVRREGLGGIGRPLASQRRIRDAQNSSRHFRLLPRRSGDHRFLRLMVRLVRGVSCRSD